MFIFVTKPIYIRQINFVSLPRASNLTRSESNKKKEEKKTLIK